MCRCCVPQRFIFTWQHYIARGIVFVANLTTVVGDISLLHKQFFLGVTQQTPVPIADGVVFVILNIVDVCLLAKLQWYAGRRIEGITVGHDVQQFHAAVRSGSDSQRDLHGLTIGIWSTGVGRDILVVDVYLSLDVPIVCGHGIVAAIFTADVIAVVDDGLRAMDEVAGSLPFLQITLVVCVVLSGNGILVQFS